MKVQRAAVVGACVMGSGIARGGSAAGVEVKLMDLSAELVDCSLAASNLVHSGVHDFSQLLQVVEI